MEVTASEFARMCGVSPMAISKKIKNGTLIKNSGKKLDTDNPVNRRYLERKQAKLKARLEMQSIEAAAQGTALDAPAMGSPSVETFSGQEQSAETKNFLNPSAAASTNEKKSGGLDFGMDADGNIADAGRKSGAELRAAVKSSEHKPRLVMNMTIAELLRTFGTMDNIEQFSKIQRDLSVADEREQRTQERRMIQIPKDFVVQRFFGYVDSLMNQLLDVPEAVCDQVIATSLAGGNDCRTSVMRILSDNLTKCISGAKTHIIGELNALRGKYDKQEQVAESLQAQLAELQER